MKIMEPESNQLLTQGTELEILAGSERQKEPMVSVGMDHAVLRASEVSKELLRAKGKWPFDLFPDELIIEEKRIVIKRNIFPFFSTTTTLPISRLTLFEWNKSILFSSVFIKGAYTDNIEITISWLSHRDAKKAKELIDGLSMKQNEAMEIMEHDRGRFIKALRIMGQT